MSNCELFLYVLVLIINIIIYKYFDDIDKEKCKCAQGWENKYIKLFCLISIFSIISIYILSKITSKEKILNNKLFRFISIILSTLSMIVIYILFNKSKHILLSDCSCSKNWKTKIIYYYSLSITSIYLFIVMFILISPLCIN